MSHANSALLVSDLDFDDIRSGLKTFLSAQTQFQDYDFDGSGMSVLLDLLAYNTHYNSYYANMVANEQFLESAVLRNNVISRAKELGYTPRSAQGAEAEVTIQIVPTTAVTSISIPVNTEFTSTIDEVAYTFVNSVAHTLVADTSNNYIQTAVTLVEGLPLTHTFTVSDSSPVDYILPNKNVDTRSITVQIQESSTDTTIATWTLANDLTEVKATSKVYFLHETDDEKFEIKFGDGVIGKQPVNGNLVVITYRVCNTIKGNGADTFTEATAIDGHTDITVTTTTDADGGVEIETVDSIKFNAPKHHERQGRVVTVQDYQRVVLAENTDFDAVAAWGGEDNDPQVFGKVYLAVKPTIGETLSDARKAALVTSLKTRNVLSIDPVFVDAEFLYVVPTIEVIFNPDLTTKSAGTLKSEVSTTLSDWQTNQLNAFGKVLRYSKFTEAIDDTDLSILSNQTTLKMQKRITPTLSVATQYVINFVNSIQNSGSIGDVISTTFTSQGYTSFIQDNSDGSLDIVRTSGAQTVVVEANIGTVDYSAGTVTLNSFSPTAVANEGILKINVIPVNKDINPLREQIILIADETISTTEDREV